MSHIDELLSILDLIIPDTTAEIMTPTDWLMIVLACYFHDMGLLVTKFEFENRSKSSFPDFKDNVLLDGDDGIDILAKLARYSEDEKERFYYQEYVRCHHADRIYHWVTGHAPVEFGDCRQIVEVINDLLGGLPTKLREDLALICRSHHKDDLDQLDIYKISRAYGQDAGTDVSLQYAALLLRQVDLLHMRNNRVPSVMFKLIDPKNPKSQEEWAKQKGVRAIRVKRSEGSEYLDTISVHADFDDAAGFFGLSAYINYVRTQLEQSYHWADAAKRKGAKHELPWRYIDSTEVEARGFLTQQFEYTFDRNRVLDLLTGHTLYNDTTFAVRELMLTSLRFSFDANASADFGGSTSPC